MQVKMQKGVEGKALQWKKNFAFQVKTTGKRTRTQVDDNLEQGELGHR
jgi:hypothetical protein